MSRFFTPFCDFRSFPSYASQIAGLDEGEEVMLLELIRRTSFCCLDGFSSFSAGQVSNRCFHLDLLFLEMK